MPAGVMIGLRFQVTPSPMIGDPFNITLTWADGTAPLMQQVTTH